MPYIYEPRGRAREYSPLALNHYLGCDHGCAYCYNRPRYPCDLAKPRDINWVKFEAELAEHNYNRQVLLSFIGDPYCRAEMEFGVTRRVLKRLSAYQVPTAILTKGGTRVLRDLDIITSFGAQIKVGATITFLDEEDRKKWEPGAASTADRIAALSVLKRHGIWTWVSMEPVIDPTQTLAAIHAVAPSVREIRIGMWNHDERAKAIDWNTFGWNAYAILCQHSEKSQLRFYMKEGLRRAMVEPEGIHPYHCDPDPDLWTAGRLWE